MGPWQPGCMQVFPMLTCEAVCPQAPGKQETVVCKEADSFQQGIPFPLISHRIKQILLSPFTSSLIIPDNLPTEDDTVQATHPNRGCWSLDPTYPNTLSSLLPTEVAGVDNEVTPAKDLVMKRT